MLHTCCSSKVHCFSPQHIYNCCILLQSNILYVLYICSICRNAIFSSPFVSVRLCTELLQNRTACRQCTAQEVPAFASTDISPWVATAYPWSIPVKKVAWTTNNAEPCGRVRCARTLNADATPIRLVDQRRPLQPETVSYAFQMVSLLIFAFCFSD